MDSMETSIRSARSADHPELVAIWRRAVEATHDFLTPADIDWYEGSLPGYLAEAEGLLVACSESRLLGFGAGVGGQIDMLFVDPAVHGRGIGSRLLAALSEGQETVLVDVNQDNPSGRAFYAAKGFKEASRSEVDDQGRPFPILHLRRDQ